VKEHPVSNRPYLAADPARPRGAYTIRLTPAYSWTGPLRPVGHTTPADEEKVTDAWATRLSYLADPHPQPHGGEPPIPRQYRAAELALPPTGDMNNREAYRYPLILRFTDPDSAQALSDQLERLAARLRQPAPDPFGGCLECVRAPYSPHEQHTHAAAVTNAAA
jgi:hypothetical protein